MTRLLALISVFASSACAESLERMLLQAAQSGDVKTATAALMRGARPNYQETATGDIALHRAVRQRDAEMVATLLKFGANANAASKTGEIPLQALVDEPDTKIASMLLRAGCYVPHINVDGKNILLVAVRKGRFAFAKLLVELGHGDLFLRDEAGDSLAALAIHHVMEFPYKEEEVADFLNWLRKKRLPLDLPNSVGQKPIDLALASGRPDVIVAVDWKGLHRKGITELSALSPEERLALAIEKNDLETARRQIPKAKLAEVEAKLQISLVAFAIESQNHELLELLAKHGASLTLLDPNGLPPLAVALKNDDYTSASILVSAGANSTAFDKSGFCPLFIACATGKLSFVKLFVQAGAKLTVTNPKGLNALMCAVSSGNVELAQYLINAGLSPQQSNAKGQTAADIAAASGEIGMVRLLDVTGKHTKLVKEFTPVRNNPYVGSWQSTGETAGQLKLDFAQDGTGMFSASGETGRLVWKTNIDLSAEAYIKQPQGVFNILVRTDYATNEIFFDNDGVQVRLAKVLPEGQQPAQIAANDSTMPKLRTKEKKPDSGDHSAQGLAMLPEDPDAQVILTLDLSYNAITSIDGIRSYRDLQKLNLRNNRLFQLPEELCDLRHLQVLDASDNQLALLPGGVGSLKHLENLDLSHNELQSIPDGLWKCNLMKELNLASNHLTEFPRPVAELPALQKLSLANNELYEVPSTIGKLTRLKELDLSYNKITELPPALAKMNNLKLLRLQGNPMTDEQREKIRKTLPRIAIQFIEEEIAPPTATPPVFKIKPVKGALPAIAVPGVPPLTPEATPGPGAEPLPKNP